MTAYQLLAMAPEVTVLLIVAVGLCGVALLVGIFRKFSRESWTGVQVLLTFGLVVALEQMLPKEGEARFFGMAALVIISTVVVLLIGGALRAFIRSRRKRPGIALRILNRVGGGLTSLVNLLVFLAVIGGGVLNVLCYCLPEAGMGELFANDLWVGLAPYVGDLFLVSLFVVVLGSGYRLGFFRAVWALLAIVLTAGAFAGAVLTAFNVGFVRSLALKIGAGFSGMWTPVAALFGYAITSLIVFVLYAAVLIALAVLVNWLLKKLDRVKVFRAIDGAVMGVIACALLLVVVIGTDVAVAQAAGGAMGEAVTEIAQGLVRLCTSSPVAEAFYQCNPFAAMFGGV